MINYFKRTIKDRKIREILRLEIGCWVKIIDPSPEEINYLIKGFGLDRRNLESGLDQNEIPRLDFVDEDIYFFAKNVSGQKTKEIETFLIVITKGFILTLSRTEPAFIEKILKGGVSFITTQKLKCLIKLFSLMNESFERLTIEVVKRVQKERRSLSELQEKELAVLLEQEDILNRLVSSYYHMNLLYERVVRRIKFFEQDKEIFEDLTTEATQGLNLCKSSLKTISNLRNYYEISLSSKLNKIITILTVFTIIISIPAAISGIYGMNVLLPLAKNPFVFLYLLLLIVGIWLAFIFYLKKKKII